MTQDAPSDADESLTISERSAMGNVLANASHQITSFEIEGAVYQPGQTAQIDGVGAFTLNADGSYDLAVGGLVAGEVKLPVINYTVSNGFKTDLSQLNLTLNYPALPKAVLTDGDENVGDSSPFFTDNLLDNASNLINGEQAGRNRARKSIFRFVVAKCPSCAGCAASLKHGLAASAMVAVVK